MISELVVEKRYLTADARERVEQDERSLRYLTETLGTIHWNGWELRTVKPIGPSEDGGSLQLEYVPGTVAAHLSPELLVVAEQLFGVWLGNYEQRVLGGAARGTIFTDLSLHNAILDVEGRRFVVIDPGKDFGREGCIYEDLVLHFESLLSCCVRRRLNPRELVDAFLDGYVATRAVEFDWQRYTRSLVRVKGQVSTSLLRRRPFRLPAFVAVSGATLPMFLWHVPRRLTGGRAGKP